MYPAGRISVREPALDLLSKKGNPSTSGCQEGQEVQRETENNYYALENIKKLIDFSGLEARVKDSNSPGLSCFLMECIHHHHSLVSSPGARSRHILLFLNQTHFSRVSGSPGPHLSAK